MYTPLSHSQQYNRTTGSATVPAYVVFGNSMVTALPSEERDLPTQLYLPTIQTQP